MKYVIVATHNETGLSQDIGIPFSTEQDAKDNLKVLEEYYTDYMHEFSLIVQERI